MKEIYTTDLWEDFLKRVHGRLGRQPKCGEGCSKSQIVADILDEAGEVFKSRGVDLDSQELRELSEKAFLYFLWFEYPGIKPPPHLAPSRVARGVVEMSRKIAEKRKLDHQEKVVQLQAAQLVLMLLDACKAHAFWLRRDFSDECKLEKIFERVKVENFSIEPYPFSVPLSTEREVIRIPTRQRQRRRARLFLARLAEFLEREQEGKEPDLCRLLEAGSEANSSNYDLEHIFQDGYESHGDVYHHFGNAMLLVSNENRQFKSGSLGEKLAAYKRQHALGRKVAEILRGCRKSVLCLKGGSS